MKISFEVHILFSFQNLGWILEIFLKSKLRNKVISRSSVYELNFKKQKFE